MTAPTHYPYYVYMILCENGGIYTGYTTDPVRRYWQHRSGRGAQYTRGHKPLGMIYLEPFGSQRYALRRESQIKRFSRAIKIYFSTIPDCQPWSSLRVPLTPEILHAYPFLNQIP